ncbi:MAG: glycosyltransferase family 2 protein [Methylovirgula sp.]
MIELPLVSVIIVNYNYGRFLRQAVDSVLGQTHPNVECILVDNASTDESGEIITALQAKHNAIKVLRRAANDGQTAASLDGLAVSSGQYVIFLDADDMLLPDCVETHVFVHLSLRLHVGFTAGDMLQVFDDRIVVTTGEAMNRYIRRHRSRRKELLRPYLHHPPNSDAAPATDAIAGNIFYVPPLSSRWVWSATSGHCYRRDALLLFSDNEGLAQLSTGTDMYFAHGIGALCGSVLIDKPLFVYRFHGSNIYSRRAQLNRTICYTPGGTGDSNNRARMLLIDHFVGHPERFAPTLPLKLNFLALLFLLDVGDIDRNQPFWRRRSRTASRLVVHFDKIAAIYGMAGTKLLMALFGVPLDIVWAAGTKSRSPASALD